MEEDKPEKVEDKEEGAEEVCETSILQVYAIV